MELDRDMSRELKTATHKPHHSQTISFKYGRFLILYFDIWFIFYFIVLYQSRKSKITNTELLLYIWMIYNCWKNKSKILKLMN